jgi:predicted enzyme related to lactoylglutathione lyase
VSEPPPILVEFPADDPGRAVRFWEGVLGTALEPRGPGQGQGWQAVGGDRAVGIHPRASGPGDRVSLPYFGVADVPAALERVEALGGSVIHRGEPWSICRDSEGSPFGLGPIAPPPQDGG